MPRRLNPNDIPYNRLDDIVQIVEPQKGHRVLGWVMKDERSGEYWYDEGHIEPKIFPSANAARQAFVNFYHILTAKCPVQGAKPAPVIYPITMPREDYISEVSNISKLRREGKVLDSRNLVVRQVA